jgi:hypothetical protein
VYITQDYWVCRLGKVIEVLPFWGTQRSSCLSLFYLTWGRLQLQFPKRCFSSNHNSGRWTLCDTQYSWIRPCVLQTGRALVTYSLADGMLQMFSNTVANYRGKHVMFSTEPYVDIRKANFICFMFYFFIFVSRRRNVFLCWFLKTNVTIAQFKEMYLILMQHGGRTFRSDGVTGF